MYRLLKWAEKQQQQLLEYIIKHFINELGVPRPSDDATMLDATMLVARRGSHAPFGTKRARETRHIPTIPQ